jgi:hypothetical protein
MPSVMFEAVEVRLVKVEIAEHVLEKREALVDAGKCIRCEESLEGKQVRKGCCPACYTMGLRDLEKRATTKRELVTSGHWRDGSKGRPLKNKRRRGGV